MPSCRVAYHDVADYLDENTPVLLKHNPRRQQILVRDAIDGIRRQLPKADLNLIGLHATHLCASVPVFPCQAGPVARLSPDIFVTLFDDVYACRKRLTKTGYPYTYAQLLNWRQLECAIGDYLAEACQVQNMCLAVKHPRLTLFRLLFEPRLPRMYSASPISNVRGSPTLREEIDAHRAVIHQEYVVFDPLTVDDRILVNTPPAERAGEFYSIARDLRWPCELARLGAQFAPLVAEDEGVFPIAMPLKETEELSKPVENSSFRGMIDAQITNRDFRYIDQGDVMVAYRPRLGGQESTGVAAEKTYASHTAAKPVIEYSPPEDTARLSSRPFSADLAGPILAELPQFYESLKATAGREANRRYGKNKKVCDRFESFREAFAKPRARRSKK